MDKLKPPSVLGRIPRQVRNVRAAVIALVVLALVSGGGFYFWQQKGKEEANRSRSTLRVKRGPVDLTVVATGVIKPDREVKISPKQTGLLKELLVKQGDFVKQGQLLAVMDDSNLVGQVESARGAYLEAEDNYRKMRTGNRPQEIAAARYQTMRAEKAVRQAADNINRLQSSVDSLTAQLKRDEVFAARQGFLASNGAVSDQDKINAETAAQVTRSQLRGAQREKEQAGAAMAQAEAELQAVKEQQKLTSSGFRAEDIAAAGHNAMESRGNLLHTESLLNDTRVRAPFDGVVTQKYTDIGAIVTPTTSAATTSATSSSIVALAGKLEMVAQVSETSVPKISTGQEVEITATAYPDRVFRGLVTQIAPAAIVTQNVTTFEVHADIVNDRQGQLLSGMNVSAKFLVGRRDDALTVPTVVVVSRRGQTGVFVPDQSGNPVFKQIKTGATVGREIIVERGLKAGDVIFEGLSRDQLAQQGYGDRPGGASGGLGGMLSGGRGGGRRGGGGRGGL